LHARAVTPVRQEGTIQYPQGYRQQVPGCVVSHEEETGKSRTFYRTQGCNYYIYWRVADAIPLVAYATFFDIFMIIIYATLVIVLVFGILIMKFAEMKDTAKVDIVYSWSVRIIPPLSMTLYIILFIAF